MRAVTVVKHTGKKVIPESQAKVGYSSDGYEWIDGV